MSAVLFSVRRRDLAWSLALIVVLSSIWVARSDIADAGSEPSGDGIAVVYIAVGTVFADSLGAGPGAGLNGAPLIIVPTNPPLHPSTTAELIRLDPRTVVIIGGLAAVSQATEDDLVALLPNAVFSRIAGANRYATNAMFSEATYPIEGWVSLPTVAFTAHNPDSDVVSLNGGIATNQTDETLFAPIQLPDGATVLELRAVVFDNDAAGVIQVQLLRADAVTYASSIVAFVSTLEEFAENAPHLLSTTSINTGGLEIVDNETYVYFIYVSGADFNKSLRSVGVRYQLGASTG